MKRKFRIAAVGQACIDYYTEDSKKFPGGSSASLAVFLKSLGVDSSFIGYLTEDKDGEYLRKNLEDKGVDLSHSLIQKTPTVINRIKVLEGDRVTEENKEDLLGEIEVSEEDLSFIAEHDLIFIPGIELNEDLIKDLKKTEKPIAVYLDKDASSKELAVYADYLFISSTSETTQELKSLFKELKELGPSLVMAIRGKKGCLAYNGKNFYHLGAVEAKTVDTTGATEAYIAGILASLVQGKSLEDAMEVGAFSYSVVEERLGAWS